MNSNWIFKRALQKPGFIPGYLVLLLLVTGLSATAIAQEGTIRGTVVEISTGEPLLGVSVAVVGTTTGTVTDFDGKFDLKLAPGTYDLKISYLSFKTVTISGLGVKENEVTVIDVIGMEEAIEELQEVVITAEVIERSESALIMLKRNSVNLLDGISSGNFRRIGDSDAAAAVKRVTGVSVEGGKYVYVRGLGDRYTKTMLNGVEVPGLDPDRNSIQMDMFPTSLLDNMMVTKSFAAELSADFTGGAVNIKTKDFPEEKVFEISLGLGYTPGMHFNNQNISAREGKTDFLGFDDGTREIPELAKNSVIPSPISGHSGEEVNRFLHSFNPNLSIRQDQSLMDFSIGVSLANQKQLGSGQKKIGYLLSLSYKNESELLDDVLYGEYQRYPDDANKYEMRYATIQNGVLGSNSVLLAGLGGLSLKTQHAKYQLTLMHLQNGESQAGMFDLINDGAAVGQSGYVARSENLNYNERSLTNAMLGGVHHLSKRGIKVDWRISPTLSRLSDPDIRKTAFTITPTNVFFSAGAAGLPSRIWRSLDELNVVGKVDVTKDYVLFEKSASLKVGGSHVYKDRDYEILSFDMQFFGTQPDFEGSSKNVYLDEYLFPNGTIYYSSANNDPNPNAYNGNVNSSGVYVSNEFSPFEWLKVSLGLRGEQYVMRHTGRDIDHANSGVGNNLENDIVLDDLGLFPMANLIWSVSDRQNLRLAYSQTIARPTFKELSFAQILDPLTNRYFNGGLYPYPDWDGKLGSSHIQNLDLRWELFFGQAQLVSFGVFYKSFDDPIELVRIPQQQTTTEYQPRNVGHGELYGTEIELRRNLSFLPGVLEHLTFSANVTLVRSSIKMTESEFNSRKQYERTGETITNTRRMAGQAPYVINGGISYEGEKIQAGLYYNVKGSTLSVVGGGLFPDVYVTPFNSLNFNANIELGASQRTSLNVSVSNILNDKIEEVYTSFNAQDQVYSRYSPGVAFGVGLKYNLAK